MNDSLQGSILEKQNWNEYYLSSSLLENPEFFGKNGTEKPLTKILNEIYPQYLDRKSYLKSLIFPQKINVEKSTNSLKELGSIIDWLDLLDPIEEEYYNNNLSFFQKNFGSIYDISEDIELEHEDMLYSLRLFAFLKGETTISDLEINFDKTQKDLYNKGLYTGPSVHLFGEGSTLIGLSSVNISPYYGSEMGFFVGGWLLSMYAMINAHKLYTFPTEIAYLYLKEKCQRADIFIEDLIKEN